jgi:ABC-type transport system substrate-binding protein/DNA-binding SARP family transcriptional activator
MVASVPRRDVVIASQECFTSDVDFSVLGPIEARDEERQLSLGGPKQRALLAVLLLERNTVVSRDRLIDAVWAEQPPVSAAHTLDAYVSRLRKLLGADRLTRRSGGYVLRTDAAEVDLDRFDELVARGREELAAGQAAAAAATLRAALGEWRGTALADLLYEPFAAEAAATLEEHRLNALEERIEADLASGRAAELVGELERLVREHPFRERLLGQLMVALYRSGQQARALDAYRVGRHRLAEELGLEPGRALQELERAILAHDPSLSRPDPPSLIAPRRRLERRWFVAAAATAVIVGTAIGLAVVLRSPSDPVAFGSDGLVALAAHSDAVRAGLEVTSAPAAVASGYGSLWIAEPGRGRVERVDPTAGTVEDRITIGGSPSVLAVGGSSVWAASVAGDSVARIDPSTGTVTQTIRLGGSRLSALGFGRGALWIADATDASLLEIDPASGTVRRTVTLSSPPSALAVTDGALWVADYPGGTVSEVDPRAGNVLATVPVGGGPSALAVTPGSVWVANALDSTVARIDARRGAVTATLPVGSGPTALAVTDGSVWVANRYGRSVSRIDTHRGLVVKTVAVEGSPTAFAVVDKHVWVGMQSVAPRRGGTVTLLHARPITVDPALQADVLPLVSDRLTRDGLVTYEHAEGVAGTRLVPDLAMNVPVATGGGTKYTFRLRPGIRYSDGRLVRAADYRRAIERTFRLDALTKDAFKGLVGAAACGPSRCDLSRGIVTDDSSRTVAFRLRDPQPDFLANLTTAAASPVPQGTPWHRTDPTPIPGTGPYEIREATAKRIVWERNPHFHEWSHAAQPDGNPDRIVMRFGLSPTQEVREIEAGRADALIDNIPAQLLPGIRTRRPSQLHSYVIPTTDFFQFNTTRAPFDDVRVRRALNLAIDRRHIIRLYGGSALATAACQVLPPGIPGHRRYCPYPHDLALARRLVDSSGTRGQRITVWGWTDDPTISVDVVRYIAGVLTRLGYRADVHLMSHRSPTQPTPYDSIQLLPAAWGDTPYGFFATWFACDGPNVHGWFCDRRIDRLNGQARSFLATRPREAARLWARIDRELVDRALWLPMINERGIDFLSTRVANYGSHPYWGLFVDQLSVRR